MSHIVHLNITHDFGPHGHLSGIKIAYICMEAATLIPLNVVHETLQYMEMREIPRNGCLPGTLWCIYTIHT